MPKIAIIDKCPSKAEYNRYFDFEYDHYHLSSVYISKLLKRDANIVIDTEEYDFIILVGAEATKHFAGVGVTQTAGTLLDGKYLPLSNPAMLSFKPEGKPDFERAVSQIKKYVKGEITNSSITGDFKGIDTEEEAFLFLREILVQEKTVVAFDTETTSLYPREGYILGISLAYKLKHGRYISTDILTEEHISLLQQILDKHQIVFHNRKFDEKWINYHFGLKFKADSDDTMLEHYILDETQGSHGLKALAVKYTLYGDYDAKLEAFKAQYCSAHGVSVKEFTYDAFPFELISEYAAIDAAVTLELHYKFTPLIAANSKLKWVYDNILIPGTVLLMDMEEFGIPMDIERLKAAEVYLDKEIEAAKKDIYSYPEVVSFEQLQGKIFNPNSVQQLRKLLFDHIGLTPTGKLTATKAISTDAEVLEELSKEHPLPAAILKVRKLIKIKNTYISKIIPELDKDGKIRTNFNISFTTSGRLSSSGKFNAQQLPRDNAIVKACIKAPKGYVVVNQDLKTAEMYVAAVVSKDTNLQDVFITGGDFHSAIAKKVFKLKCLVEEIKKLFPIDRQASKAVSFGILFGSGPSKVAETVNKEGGNMDVQDAKDVIEEYFHTFSGLYNWLESRRKFILANGYTYSFFGRKRRLSNVFSTNKAIASHEVRSGINMEIQSVASDLNILAAIEIAAEFKRRKLDAHIFMLVHDSIVVLCREEIAEEVKEIMRFYTQKDRGCSIPNCPIGVDQDVGQDYSFGAFEEQYEFRDNILSRVSTAKNTSASIGGTFSEEDTVLLDEDE